MTEEGQRISVKQRAREIDARATRDGSPPVAPSVQRLTARKLGLSRADSEPNAGPRPDNTCHRCSQQTAHCLCQGPQSGSRLAVVHTSRKKLSAPAITPLRGPCWEDDPSPLATLNDHATCTDIRLAWETLCCKSGGLSPPPTLPKVQAATSNAEVRVQPGTQGAVRIPTLQHLGDATDSGAPEGRTESESQSEGTLSDTDRDSTEDLTRNRCAEERGMHPKFQPEVQVLDATATTDSPRVQLEGVTGHEAAAISATSPRPDENSSGAIFGEPRKADDATPLDDILQSLEQICSEFEEGPQPPAAVPVQECQQEVPSGTQPPDGRHDACMMSWDDATSLPGTDNKVGLVPKLQVKTLTRLPSGVRSNPTSPTPLLVRAKPEIPAYLTLGRRPQNARSSDDVSLDVVDDAIELEKIRSILANIDFSRYRRKRASEDLVQTEHRKEAQPFQRSLSATATMEKPSMSHGSKLKELTEKLKNSAASSSSMKDLGEGGVQNPSVSDSTSNRSFPTVCRSASFTTVDGSQRSPHVSLGGSVTLPRKATTTKALGSYLPQALTSTFPLSQSAGVKPHVPEDMAVSNLSLDSAVESIVDETGYQDQQSCAPQGIERRRFFRGCQFAPADDDGTRGPPQPPEKRKRRKAFTSPSGSSADSRSSSKDIPPKQSSNRSLTYPPQRRTSGSEEELEFSSMDSNGLKSLHVGRGGRNPGKIRQPSDVSLADSHFCPSETTGEETFRDVVESLSAVPVVEDRAVKQGGKKKYYSDPSGDNTGGTVDLPEVIAACKSEPGLVERARERPPQPDLSSSPPPVPQHKRQHSGPAAMTLSSSGTPSRITLSDSERATSDTERMPSSRSPQQQRRYSKKRLRGPYGEMLEEEMRKSGEKQKPSFCEDLSFLQGLCDKKGITTSTPTSTKSEPASSTPQRQSNAETTTRSRPALLSNSLSLDDAQLKSTSSRLEANVPKRKISANFPILGTEASDSSPFLAAAQSMASAPGSQDSAEDSTPPAADARTVRWLSDQSTPEKDTQASSASAEGSPSLSRTASLRRHQDTRTHVVGELYDTEKSYVESLQILVNKYIRPLKSAEWSSMVDATLVDEIFYQVPEILGHHEAFLEVLRQRLSSWDTKQKVGDVFVEAFTKQPVIDTYTAFINNWKSAKEAIKMATQTKPAFAKFLEHTSRMHKGKLTLDALLIMPVQRIPRYELLIKELVKHTQHDHPDHQLLVLAQKEVHDLAVKINRMEREAFQHEQMQQRVRDIEQLIEGVIDLVQPDRTFIRYDFVTIPGGLGTKKDRCLFLFSDLLLITSIKRKSGTMRKTSPSSSSPSGFGFTLFDMNKYKLLLRFSLDNLDILKSSDVGLKKAIREAENLEEDMSLLNQITDLVSHLNCPHQTLEDAVKDLMVSLNKQMQERQNYDLQLLNLQLSITTQEGVENITIIFPSTEKRSSWEAAFNEAKQKLALSTDRRPPPEFLHPLPIRKTRAGLQFTCAVATLGLNEHGLRDVWVCNSDGYVGQVCVLSLQPEPTVMSCNGVCNARILCIASIPAASSLMMSLGRRRSLVPDTNALAGSDSQQGDVDVSQTQSANGNIQLDSDSSDDEEEGEDEDEDVSVSQEEDKQGAPPQESAALKEEGEEADNHYPTMWLGTEDGCVHVYNCNDNIRIKKNKMKVQHSAAVHCIIYLDNRVFISLSSGDIAIYRRGPDGGWNTTDSQMVQVGSSTSPVLRMLAVAGKLWCGCQNYIKVFNTAMLDVEHFFQVSSDSSRAVLCMVTSGLGVWLAVQHSAVIRLYHATTYECLQDVNIAPAVTKMLSACDDIIRQHKAACLRVTALLACKDLLWVGTSAGVLLTLPLPHLTSSTTRLDTLPNIAGIPHGHTGHVRFLTAVEMTELTASATGRHHRSVRSSKETMTPVYLGRRASLTPAAGCRVLVISGGDGYEDFRSSGLSEAAGRDDSTNHLLLWQV